MSLIKLNCQHCGKEFERQISPWHIKNGRGKYCSRKCSTQICGEFIEEKPEVHHIKKFSKYKKLRTNIDNGITLCKECHDFISHKESDWENFFNYCLGLLNITDQNYHLYL